MKCAQCGSILPDGQKACLQCGAIQETPAEEKTEITEVAEEATGATADLPPLVSLSDLNEEAEQAQVKEKKPLTRKQLIIRIAIIAVSVLAALAIVLVSTLWLLVDSNIQQESAISEGEVDVNTNVPAPSSEVTNIALFGLDTRSNNDSGRSDAMIILSIDRKHNQIKMTSLARDSLVAIEGYGKSKLTHAWAFGKAKLAVKTINQNFGMNITDYVYVNFYEFAEIVDHIGGVYIDVDYSEMGVMNRTYAPYIRKQGIHCPDVTQTGYQLLCGGQALAYSRNRYTGNDQQRGDRQKEVLEAMFAAVKDVPLTKYPSLISKILGMCNTTLTTGEMMSLATWAMTKQPTFNKFSLPCKELNARGGVAGSYGWVYVYDMALATAYLHEFIYEDNTDMSTVTTHGIDANLFTRRTTTSTTVATDDTTAPTRGTGGVTTGTTVITTPPTGQTSTTHNRPTETTTTGGSTTVPTTDTTGSEPTGDTTSSDTTDTTTVTGDTTTVTTDGGTTVTTGDTTGVTTTTTVTESTTTTVTE